MMVGPSSVFDLFDNGSYDNCSNVRREIRVPGVPTANFWSECHTLRCNNLGVQTVELRIWDDRNGDGLPGDDSNGDNTVDDLDDDNFNTCWANLVG